MKNFRHRRRESPPVTHNNLLRKLVVYRKNFTLVELLVVIAILSILAALLLPALKNAKDMAKGIVCANKLKQLYLLSNAYVENNRGWAPYAPWEWKGKLQEFLPKYVRGSSTRSSLVSGNADKNIFYCPSAIEIPSGSFDERNCAYTANYTGGGSMNVNRIHHPDTQTWLMDSRPVPAWGYRAGDWNSLICIRHSGNTAYKLFWDSHVATCR